MNATPCTLSARAAAIGDWDSIAGLLRRVFGVETNRDILCWKYAGSEGRTIGSAVLAADRRIVGFLGQIPVRIRVAGHDRLAAQGADVAIEAEYRRLDAFLSLTDASTASLRAAGISLAYGIANSQATDPLSILLGEQRVAATPLLVRPLGRLFPPPAHSRTGANVVRPGGFDTRFDRFWLRIRDDYPIMLARDAAHLNWRYAETSGRAYERLAVEHPATGEIEGYAVLTIDARHHGRRGRICDLVTPRNADPQAAHTLIAESLRWFQSNKCRIADIWMFRHTHLHPVLLRHVFIPRKTNAGGLHAAPLTPEAAMRIPGIEQPTRWHLSLGDSDTV